MHYNPLLLIALCGLAVSAVAQTSVLTLADINPGTNAFRVSDRAGAQSIDGVTGNLLLGIDSGGSNGGLVYNTVYFAPVTLTAGQSITVAFTVTTTNANAANDSFRVGLFDSGNSKLSADVSGTGSATLSGYRGYSAYYRTSGATTSEARSLFERTGNNNVLWNTGTAHIALDTTQQKTLGATTLSGTFTLANINGTSVSVSSSVNGQDYSFTDSIGAFTTFDTLSFFLPRATNNSAASLEFSSLSVTVIPEPATFASLAGLFALLGAAARRRSRR